MKEQRTHYNWRKNLDDVSTLSLLHLFSVEARKQRKLAKKILEEGKNPGKYFDGTAHMFDFIHETRELRLNPQVKAIGIFGSRLRGDHEALRSDTDILVIINNPIYEFSFLDGLVIKEESIKLGIAGAFHLTQITPQEWQTIIENVKSCPVVFYNALTSVRWLWIKKGYEILEIPDIDFKLI